MTDAAFVRRLAIAIAAVCGVIVAWRLREVELLLFGAVLFGVFFDAMARPIRRLLRIKQGWALAIAVLAFLVVAIAALAFFGLRLEAQAADLTRRLPIAWNSFKANIRGSPFGATILNALDQMSREAGGRIAPEIRKYALSAGSVLLGLLLIIISGVYLAARPASYRQGVLRLVPERRREEAGRFLDLAGRHLRRWLLAQAAAMLTVGVLTALALWAIGVPAAGALGVLAAIGEFVPMLGVFVASAPALLLSAMGGWQTVVWMLVLLTAIHQFDGDILQPFLQRGFNSVPPVVTLFAMVGFGAFLGLLGLIFAMPLTLVCYAAAEVWLPGWRKPRGA